MKMSRPAGGFQQRFQRGALAVEFALIAALFLMTLLIGIIELGRAFFYINATAEATRRGARIAVVCGKGTADKYIRARMREYVNVLPDTKIDIQWDPDPCFADSAPICRRVTVRILSGATFETLFPGLPLTWTLPPFATTLPRESMQSDVDNAPNPACS